MDVKHDDIVLELENIRLSINPNLGASIASLSIRNPLGQWADVLRTMPEGSTSASDAGSFMMLPWTNRIKDARFRFNNADYPLVSNCSDGSAIHGVGRNLPWQICDRSPITARFVLDSRKSDPDSINYPFAFGAIARFEIGPKGVDLDCSITNLDDHPIPVGCGHHPYIHRHLFSQADELKIRLDVSGRYPAQDCIPVDEPIDDEVCQSLRAGNPIGNPNLDDVFAGFGGVAKLDWPESNVSMTMHCSKNLNHLVIYTPVDESGEADEYVCIEPVSMVNDGFNRFAEGKNNTGVVLLEPKQIMRTQMSLNFSTCH